MGAEVKFKKQKFKTETAQKMLKVARDDIYAAEILATAPKSRPETILYHVQQSIEKSIKAVTIHRNQAVFLTHDEDVPSTRHAYLRKFLESKKMPPKSPWTRSNFARLFALKKAARLTTFLRTLW